MKSVKDERKKGLRGGLTGLVLLLASLLLAACGSSPASNSAAPVGTTAAVQTAGANPAATPAANAKEQPPIKVAVGFTAPNFTAKGVDGQPVRLSDYRGKAVLINFWAVY